MPVIYESLKKAKFKKIEKNLLHFTNNYDVYVSGKSHNLKDLLHIEQKISMYSYYINITKLMSRHALIKKQERNRKKRPL